MNAVSVWTGDLLIVDTEDLQTIPPSESHVEIQIKKKWQSSRETANSFSHDERAKSCKRTAIIYLYILSGRRPTWESQQHSSETEEVRDPDDEAPQDFWSIMKKVHFSELCCSQNKTLSEGRFSQTSELH